MPELIPDLKQAVKRWVGVFSIISVPITLGSFLADKHYFFDLLANFKQQIFFMLLFVVLANFVLKNFKTVLLNLLLLIAILYDILPWYMPLDESDIKLNRLRVYFSNVHTINQKHHLLLEQINTLQPEVVALVETGDKWAKSLEALREQYPYQKMVTRNDNFGVALFSQKELLEIKIKYFGLTRHPTIEALVKLDEDRSIRIWVTHPIPPTSKQNQEFRDKSLLELAETVSLEQKYKIVVGDFNASLWSPVLLEFEKKAQVLNARKGFGLLPTWPTNNFTQIPLDHCLVSDDFYVENFKVLDSIGSDHFPILTQLKY